MAASASSSVSAAFRITIFSYTFIQYISSER
jgi:hypothetical protein